MEDLTPIKEVLRKYHIPEYLYLAVLYSNTKYTTVVNRAKKIDKWLKEPGNIADIFTAKVQELKVLAAEKEAEKKAKKGS